MIEVIVVRSVQEVKRASWNSLVRHSKLGSLFHSYEWLLAVEEGLRLKARHVLAYDETGNLIGLIPNFVLKIRDTPLYHVVSTSPGFGGPLAATREEEVMVAMLRKVASACSICAVDHIIVAHKPGYVRYSALLRELGYKSEIKWCTFKLDLSRGWDHIEKVMSKKRRNRLRKGRKFAYEVLEAEPGGETLRRFYEVYVDVIRRTGGRPYPMSFLQALVNKLGDKVKLFLIMVEGEFCGGFLYLLDPDRQSMHQFFGSIEKVCFKYCASELLHEYAIKWGIERGYREYSFGGSTADFRRGTFRFKEEFGGEVEPVLSWRKPLSRIAWVTYRSLKILTTLFAPRARGHAR